MIAIYCLLKTRYFSVRRMGNHKARFFDIQRKFIGTKPRVNIYEFIIIIACKEDKLLCLLNKLVSSANR